MTEENGRGADNDSASGADPEETTSVRKRRRFGPVLLIALVLVLAAGGVWYLHYETRGKYYETTNDAYIKADAVVVAAKVAGYVDRVLVADNEQVRAGQPLLQIDPRDYRAQAAQYQAQIDVARANAEGVRAQISEQGAAVDQARAQLAAAENTLAFARAEVTRYTPLAATGAETREKLSQLRDNERQAVAQVASAQAALTSAQRRVGTLQAQVGQALSQGRAAEAQLAAANVNVGSTVIRASTDGRIGDKSVQPGQFIQPGVRLMSIVPVQNLYVEANFKETQLALMRVGQPVTVKVDALGGAKLQGQVESVSPGTGAQFSLLPPQNATGNFTKIVQRVPVRISIKAGPETRRLLVSGMSVEVTVDTISARGAKQRIEEENRNVR